MPHPSFTRVFNLTIQEEVDKICQEHDVVIKFDVTDAAIENVRTPFTWLMKIDGVIMLPSYYPFSDLKTAYSTREEAEAALSRCGHEIVKQDLLHVHALYEIIDKGPNTDDTTELLQIHASYAGAHRYILGVYENTEHTEPVYIEYTPTFNLQLFSEMKYIGHVIAAERLYP